jgi:hypothetical protein
MRKRLISRVSRSDEVPMYGWFKWESAAVVEVTSEARGHSIEETLIIQGKISWRASAPGLQRLCG